MANKVVENRANRATAKNENEDPNLSTEDKVVRNIVRTFAGGEHVLAGARASEWIYGSGKKPDQAKLDRLKREGALGIERYIAPPKDGITDTVSEQSGYPLATQPENRADATGPSNVSSEAGKAEQNVIDDALAAGRNQRENSNETAVNPAGSEVEHQVHEKATETKKR